MVSVHLSEQLAFAPVRVDLVQMSNPTVYPALTKYVRTRTDDRQANEEPRLERLIRFRSSLNYSQVSTRFHRLLSRARLLHYSLEFMAVAGRGNNVRWCENVIYLSSVNAYSRPFSFSHDRISFRWAKSLLNRHSCTRCSNARSARASYVQRP